MEMCVDNPREEFADLFATHPPIEERIRDIIKFAGGHDPGPLALPEPGAPGPAPEASAPVAPDDQQQAPAPGPWSDAGQRTASGAPVPPFLRPPSPASPDGGAAADDPGPWGPHTRN
jgi:heat shock protein HtpX